MILSNYFDNNQIIPLVMPNDLRPRLAELGLKPNEIKVYLALTKLGEASAAQVAAKAGLPRTTAISLLAKLVEENYLTRHRYRGADHYWVESPHALVVGLEAKTKVAQALADELAGMYRSEGRLPYAAVYDTRAGIGKLVERLLGSLKRGSVISTIDAPSVGNYQRIFSEELGAALFGRKKTRGIATRTLVPHGSYASIAPQKLAGQDLEIRELPPGIMGTASLWLMDDLLIHFSGFQPFAVVIRHEAIVASTRSLYAYLWSISKPTK